MAEKPEDLFRNSENTANSVISSIISQGASVIYENYLTKKSIPFAVNFTISTLSVMVEAFNIRHENQVYSQWTEDLEPTPTPIDNWARKVIPVVQKVIMPKPEPTLSFAPDLKSVKSYSSKRSGLGRGKPAKVNKLNETATIEEGILPVPIPEEKSELDEEEEFLRQQKEREMKRRKDDSERLKKIKDEEAEKEKKLLKEAEDMKKKVFTYSTQGNIIYINPVKYDNLPENFLECQYSKPEPNLEEKKPKSRKKTQKEFIPVKRVKTAPIHEKEWVKNVTTVQPTLFESIALNPNVTFVDGGRTKYPPVEKIDEKRTMTRKEYRVTHQQKQEVHQNIPVPNEMKSSDASSVNSSRKNLESKRDIFDIIPDYEDVPPSGQVSKTFRSNTPVRSLTHGRIVQYGAGNRLDVSAGPMDKFNNEILTSKNWGINPPIREPIIIERLPKKPDVKQLRDLYGNIAKKPKDAPFMSANELWHENGKRIKKPRDRPFIEKVEKKTRMPPPPYGFTMINVLPELNQLVGSGTSNKSLNKSENNK